jgi:hypothetical protein
MDRTSGQPQVNLILLLGNNSLQFFTVLLPCVKMNFLFGLENFFVAWQTATLS